MISMASNKKEVPLHTMGTQGKVVLIPPELKKRTQAELQEADDAKNLEKAKEKAFKEKKAADAKGKHSSSSQKVAAFEDEQTKKDKVNNSLRPDLALKKKKKSSPVTPAPLQLPTPIIASPPRCSASLPTDESGGTFISHKDSKSHPPDNSADSLTNDDELMHYLPLCPDIELPGLNCPPVAMSDIEGPLATSESEGGFSGLADKSKDDDDDDDDAEPAAIVNRSGGEGEDISSCSEYNESSSEESPKDVDMEEEIQH